ncbi:hypothetical protein FJT64_015044 [Amphibalanus amphitrite]|uniref:Uncharacterized protein n=1 Tax=Amphibalanus amphitrite TaxID=1232801 RepID=A0A6A4XEJ9_AMPAM|nr:uncharacterized protein LOC122389987 [Amphibalanus amphitrite]KAF0314464.1 hypothetical protein FJT64_015044 [Amphibalanus amphitrite]
MQFAVLFSMVAAASAVQYPPHASCKADWTFGVTCEEAKQAIIDQMNAWTGPEGCADGGEKCLYEVLSTDGNVVTGTHTTPTVGYVDDLEFTFTDGGDGTCAMHGFSTSETSYAYLDSSTNYCNMKNLITGSGLDQSESFSEVTSDDICTQYSSANCDVY